ncbi:hypothetical protein C8J98_10191 [Luteibacter sp. OK325]|nr:hypothetical protein C8J98_10191 [Luteibacter sp. OK325]
MAKKGSSRITGAGRSAFRPCILSHLAPRTSRMARLRHRSLHLGVSRGRPWCPPSLLRQSSAFGSEGRFAAHVSIWPTAAHLCGTRLEGGHQGLSRRYGWVEGEPLRGAVVGPGRFRNTGAMRTRLLAPGCPTPSSRPCWHAGRRCCRALWLDPHEPQGSGEPSVSTLEASSAQVSGRRPDRYMGREAAFRTERGGLSEQRGWAPNALRRDVTLCAATSTPAATSPEFRDEPKKNPPLPGERRVWSYLLLTEPERSKPEPEQPCRQQPERSWQQPERRQPGQQPERPEPWQQQPGQRPG